MKRRSRSYRIEITPEADEHLAALSAHERSTLIAAIGEQLRHQPTVQTRHRKHLRPNQVAPWLLRVGHMRVYYEAKTGLESVVTVRAIGIKVRERVTIGGMEVDLS